MNPSPSHLKEIRCCLSSYNLVSTKPLWCREIIQKTLTFNKVEKFHRYSLFLWILRTVPTQQIYNLFNKKDHLERRVPQTRHFLLGHLVLAEGGVQKVFNEKEVFIKCTRWRRHERSTIIHSCIHPVFHRHSVNFTPCFVIFLMFDERLFVRRIRDDMQIDLNPNNVKYEYLL